MKVHLDCLGRIVPALCQSCGKRAPIKGRTTCGWCGEEANPAEKGPESREVDPGTRETLDNAPDRPETETTRPTRP